MRCHLDQEADRNLSVVLTEQVSIAGNCHPDHNRQVGGQVKNSGDGVSNANHYNKYRKNCLTK